MSGATAWETFDTECLSSTTGYDYIGEASRTISRIPCQQWTDQSPHAHSYDDVTYFADYEWDSQIGMDDVASYCRNPAMSEYVDMQPWCYTTSEEVVKEFCDIPRCKRKQYYVVVVVIIIRGYASSNPADDASKISPTRKVSKYSKDPRLNTIAGINSVCICIS